MGNEFRISAETLVDLREQARRAGRAIADEAGEETYLISATTDRCNAKIPDALMDIKIMIGTHRGLEQWKPMLKAGFPLKGVRSDSMRRS